MGLFIGVSHMAETIDLVYIGDKPEKKDTELEEAKKEASILKYQYLFEGAGYSAYESDC